MAAEMKVPFLDLKPMHEELRGELIAMFGDALDTCMFAGGPVVSRFEAEFAEYTGTAYCAGVSSGTDALRLALMAMGIGPGDRVATVPNTFIATTEAISQAGAEIDFVDIDPDTCLMDPGSLAELLERRSGAAEMMPAAVVPVHLYGQCADMDAIKNIAKEYGLKVLEDAAQAHGATRNGRRAGGMGDAAGFSFYPGKNLGALGEAGAVTTDDEAIADRVRILRDHGQNEKYYHLMEGYNARLDAIQAGALSVKLRKLDEWNARRNEAADFYDQAFCKLDGVRPVKIAEGCVSGRHLYVVHVERRDALREWLAGRGIGAGLHYPVPLHLQASYRGLGLGEGSFPNAEKSARELISLPMFPTITREQLSYVVGAVVDFLESK